MFINFISFISVTDFDPCFLSGIPLLTYSNADTEKQSIFKDNKRKCGIYRWVNNLNGKSYVGSATNRICRFYQYYSFKTLEIYLKNRKSAIYSALLKYGYSNFSLEILEYCDSSNLIEREQFYMDLLRPEYNILKTAGSLRI